MRSLFRTTGAVPARARARALSAATVRDIALVCLADGVVGLSFGAAAAHALPAWAPVAMSAAVFAGGAQFALVGVVLAGGSPLAGALAGLLVNSRLLPYSLAVADVIGDRWPVRLAGAHLVVDESVAFALRTPDRPARRAAFWTCGLALFAVWNLAVAGGVLAGRALGGTGAFGLDAVFPTVMAALVLPSLRDRGVREAAAAGAAVAVAATPFLAPGLPLLAGLAGLAVLVRPRRAGAAQDAR